jgi:hypothetical protein
MWREGRDAGSGLCTQTRIRTGRTEVRAAAPFVTPPAAALAAIRRASSLVSNWPRTGSAGARFLP